jgi:CelD/BcsL family acetyltransferase involved in cellulose biosynthesis
VTLDALESAWRPLAERGGNVFGTWEWADTWWRHFGAGGELRARVVDERVVLPLYVGRTGPFRLLRYIGHAHADELGPVAAPEDRGAAAEAMSQTLGEGGYHLFLGEDMPPGWGPDLGSKVVERTSYPVLELTESSWDELLANRSSNFRQQMRKYERRLDRAHSVGFRLADDPNRLPADLDTLFALHRARWPGSKWFAAAEAFHRDFAAVALERGWLRLWILELDGAPAAAWYGFRFAGVDWFYQGGRDPSLSKERVGIVLIIHTVREALRDGMREYRFLRGGEAYKSRFASSDPGLETLARPNGPFGRAALALRTLHRRGLRDG